MKAISVKQPWAALIGAGVKTIETRVWKTYYRGDLLICASAKPIISIPPPFPYQEIITKYVNENYKKHKSMAEFSSQMESDLQKFYAMMKPGRQICIVELYDIQPMTPEHEKAALCDVYPGAYSWFIRNVRPVPILPVKGCLKLFDVPDELINSVL